MLVSLVKGLLKFDVSLRAYPQVKELMNCLTYSFLTLIKYVFSPAVTTLPGSLTQPVTLSAGYILALGPLIFVSVFDVWLEKFTTKQAYVINLVSVGVVAFGCTGTLMFFYPNNG